MNDSQKQSLLFDISQYSALPEWDEYEIYHDEHKENKLIHGFLFVPTRLKNLLLSEINNIRLKYNCDSKLHYCNLSGKTENIKHKTVKEIIKIMYDALRVKNYSRSIWGDCPPRCKFALFMKQNITRMCSGYFADTIVGKKEIDIRKIETLMRIGLKGALHYLFDDNSKVKINGFYTDGIGWRRPLDKDRVLLRLHREKRDYIDFGSDLDICPVESNHKKDSCFDYDRAQLLQVCDCVLGAFINCIFGGDPNSFKSRIAVPIRYIMKKSDQRKSNFKNSGHFKSFVVTRAILKNGQWEYRSLQSEEISKVSKEIQLKLFN